MNSAAAISTATFSNDKPHAVLPIAQYPGHAGPNVCVGGAHSIYSQDPPPKPATAIASTSCLGCFAAGATLIILSLYDTNLLHVKTPNAVMGMALFTGGLAQFIAGMWEFPRGNMFGATVFTIYGTFWMSYAAILIPGTGIVAAYATATELNHAVGIYLTIWSLITFMFLVAALRTDIAHIALFIFLGLTFALLGLSDIHDGSAGAGGVLGVITSLIAFYIGMSDLLAADDQALFALPLGALRRPA